MALPEFDSNSLAEFCLRWQVVELAIFGSAIREDFTAGSDVDILVTFAPAARHSLMALAKAEIELGGIFGRRVDLVERAAVEQSKNRYRRDPILSSAQVLYAA